MHFNEHKLELFCEFTNVYLVIMVCVFFRYQHYTVSSGAKNILERSNDGPLINDSQLDIDRTFSGVQYKGQSYTPQYFVLDKDYATNSANN